MSETFYTNIEKVFADWHYSHPFFLYAFIRAIKPQNVVEVGTYRGFAACWMARALQENNTGKLHCIDNFSLKEHVERYGDPREHLEENLSTLGIREWVEIHEGESSDPAMWPEKVDMAYIDGWHSYNAVRDDFLTAKDRGAYLLALDDTENCVGPRLFSEHVRALTDGGEWDVVDIHSDNGLTIFLKRQPKRLITFSQELPLPCVGVDLRPMTLEEQSTHFAEASKVTGLDYRPIMGHTEHV